MPQTPQLNALSAAGASNAILIPHGVVDHTFETWFTHNAIESGKITALTIKVQGSLRDDGNNGVVNTEGPVLAIGSTAENVANSAFTYRIANTNYNKAAVAAGTAFTSAHVVTASKFGAINLYIDSSGTITSLSTDRQGDQTTALASASAAAAITVAEAITTPPNQILIGRVLIEADAGGWTAITDDLTDGSDLTTATFISASPAYVDIATHVYNASDLVAQRAAFTLSNTWFKYMRMFLSSVTGTGKVYGQHIPGSALGV